MFNCYFPVEAFQIAPETASTELKGLLRVSWPFFFVGGGRRELFIFIGLRDGIF